MYIFLILYFIFLLCYIAFNAYGIIRVNAMRVKGDATGTALLIYILAMVIIILISVIVLSRLAWTQSLLPSKGSL